MLNFLTTFGAETQFQKNRLLLTKTNYDAPNEQAMKNILHTFAGEDQQTRSQIAFACIIKKINNSPAKQNWIYLLKNLLILDRVMADNRFCQELFSMTLHTVEYYRDKDHKSQAINASALLKEYWQIIKQMSGLKTSKRHILHYKRSQRKIFLQGLSIDSIFKQIKSLQELFEKCISIIFLTSGISNRENQQRQTENYNERCRRVYLEFVNSPLAEYLNIHIYSKLLTFYSCQYLCIHKFIQIVMSNAKNQERAIVSVEDAKLFKKIIYKFKIYCHEMKFLVEKNKGKKGFENVDVKQFTAFSQERIINVIDQYIQQHNHVDKYHIQSKLPYISHQKHLNSKFVDRKPLIFQNSIVNTQKTPRKNIELKKDVDDQKIFQNYFNSYSEKFPHKNMMTIDLIQDIRRQEQQKYDRILRSETYQELQQNDKIQDFSSEFKRMKQKIKFKDILVATRDYTKEQEKEDSTSYSILNSSSRGNLFDVLNIKWQTPESKA